MKCDALECVVCGARFKYTHACTIEKRCPACRILYGPAGEKTKKSKHELLPISKDFISLYYSEAEWEIESKIFSVVSIDDVQEESSKEDLLERELDGELFEAILREMRSVLTKNEYIALAMKFGVGGFCESTNKEVAKKLRVTTSRAWQLESEAYKKLRTALRRSKAIRELIEG
jgi:DNA-directed RNA polymerase sigma subunit (sigma70/sigma32)